MLAASNHRKSRMGAPRRPSRRRGGKPCSEPRRGGDPQELRLSNPGFRAPHRRLPRIKRGRTGMLATPINRDGVVSAFLCRRQTTRITSAIVADGAAHFGEAFRRDPPSANTAVRAGH